MSLETPVITDAQVLTSRLIASPASICQKNPMDSLKQLNGNPKTNVVPKVTPRKWSQKCGVNYITYLSTTLNYQPRVSKLQATSLYV